MIRELKYLESWLEQIFLLHLLHIPRDRTCDPVSILAMRILDFLQSPYIMWQDTTQAMIPENYNL